MARLGQRFDIGRRDPQRPRKMRAGGAEVAKTKFNETGQFQGLKIVRRHGEGFATPGAGFGQQPKLKIDKGADEPGLGILRRLRAQMRTGGFCSGQITGLQMRDNLRLHGSYTLSSVKETRAAKPNGGDVPRRSTPAAADDFSIK